MGPRRGAKRSNVKIMILKCGVEVGGSQFFWNHDFYVGLCFPLLCGGVGWGVDMGRVGYGREGGIREYLLYSKKSDKSDNNTDNDSD